MTVVQVVVSTLLVPYTKKGPTKKQLEDLEASLEDGYICGNAIKGNNSGLYTWRALTCGDYIESQYCNPTTGLKGGRILTPDICAICYDTEDMNQLMKFIR